MEEESDDPSPEPFDKQPNLLLNKTTHFGEKL